MKVLVGASTERAAFRKLWSRLDQIAGYPRTLDPSEYTRGAGRHSGAPPYTESLFAGLIHDATGAPILNGAVTIMVDDIPAGLLSRSITYNATTRTVAEWIQWGKDNRGWQVLDALPGQAEAWTQVAPRDGDPGSPDGQPIPEGEE